MGICCSWKIRCYFARTTAAADKRERQRGLPKPLGLCKPECALTRMTRNERVARRPRFLDAKEYQHIVHKSQLAIIPVRCALTTVNMSSIFEMVVGQFNSAT